MSSLRRILRGLVGDLLAGLLLVIARPYAAGERVRLHRPGTAGEIDAELLHVGPARSTLCTGEELIAVPNRRMLHTGHPVAPPVRATR